MNRAMSGVRKCIWNSKTILIFTSLTKTNIFPISELLSIPIFDTLYIPISYTVLTPIFYSHPAPVSSILFTPVVLHPLHPYIPLYLTEKNSFATNKQQVHFLWFLKSADTILALHLWAKPEDTHSAGDKIYIMIEALEEDNAELHEKLLINACQAWWLFPRYENCPYGVEQQKQELNVMNFFAAAPGIILLITLVWSCSPFSLDRCSIQVNWVLIRKFGNILKQTPEDNGWSLTLCFLFAPVPFAIWAEPAWSPRRGWVNKLLFL